MARIAAIFVIICIAVIAVSAGAVAFLQFGATPGQAAILILLVLLVLLLAHSETLRRKDRRLLYARMDSVAAEFGGLTDATDNLEARLVALENKYLCPNPDRNPDDFESVVAEVEVLGTLTRRIAELASGLEVRIEALEQVADPGASGSGRNLPAASPPAEPGDSERDPAGAADAEKKRRNQALAAILNAALDEDRCELHMQPIVSLPQRKVRYYEALVRIRLADGRLILPEMFLPAAEANGLIERIDLGVLDRTFKILHRFAVGRRDAHLFCNVSPVSLVSKDFHKTFKALIEADRAIVSRLILEFSQTAVSAMGPLELEALHELRDYGFRFSIDQVEDLTINFHDLGQLGFRYAKVAADHLIDEDVVLAGGIHIVDMVPLLNRYGIDLIVDRVEFESQVLDALDLDVQLAQGNLFSPPKLVRTEALITSEPPSSAEREQRRVATG